MTAVTVRDIYDFLQRKAPFELQMDFDNAGFLVGHANQPVYRILVSLDITEPVIQEAKELSAQLIVSHHPVIWGGAKSMTDQTVMGRKLLSLAESHIAAICMHTNLDAAAGGVNDALALHLGLSDLEQLHQDGVDCEGRPYGIGRVGLVPRQNLFDFAQAVKELLGSRGIRLVDGGCPVHKVAVGGGACSSMVDDVIAKGCDTFVTADVKYDGFLDAKARGLNLIDAGHFPTEQVICPVLKGWLSMEFPQLTVAVSQRHQEVFSYL